MKWVRRFLFALGLAVLSAIASAANLTIHQLECDDAVNPLGVDVLQPRLGWRLTAPEGVRGVRQTAYEIVIATTPERLSADNADLWATGKVASGKTVHIRYAGEPLQSSQQVWWKARVWDENDNASAWSDPATWTMGLLRAGDWGGQWITAAEASPVLLLRREITVGPGLERALLHVTGMGSYEASINGGKISDDLLGPGWTDFAKTMLYDTRDVTAQLTEGANVLGLTVADGMANVFRVEGRFAKFVGSFGEKRARAHLELRYADGRIETVVTDPAWQTHAGPQTFAGIYGGEDYDARLLPVGWDTPSYDATAWPAAVAIAGPGGELRGHSRNTEPVQRIEVREPVNLRELSDSVTLYDFGQNTSFIAHLTVSGPAGSVVKMTGGEIVNEDGTINRSTMGGAHRGSAWWSYTKATDEVETWFPQFYYLGSRYLYVERFAAAEGAALPVVERVTQDIVHSTAAPAGHFASSDETLNRIHELVRWAQRSNMVSLLTDCPHREKLGWLEQTHLNGPALRFEWDHDRLAAKIARDMADAQTEEGLIPNVAPEYVVFKGTYRRAAEWGAAFFAVPWQHYQFTGDDTLLRELYPQMRLYLAYLESKSVDGLLDEGLGDWYDYELGITKRANLTPGKITGSAFLYQNLSYMAQIARVLGHDDEAGRYFASAQSLRAAYLDAYFRPDSPEIIGTGTQTSKALPLAMGMLNLDQAAFVENSLVQQVEEMNYFQSGAAGIRYLLIALADAGRSDLIFKIATNPELPGYAYQLAQGATSLTESWPAFKGASQNHFFLGQIVEWMYRDLVGIWPSQPGFSETLLMPTPIEALTWAEASHDTVRGTITARWERHEGRLRYTVTIPPNTTAVLMLPAKDDTITEGGHPVQDAKGVEWHRRVGERVQLGLQSGSYVFESNL
ncbi:family 78 glycoside hydrolase catalytic domain [Actomonas aquatica]|uniref:alpha-L-rhamnosidase n=1 Tax=Actomonas aquatica TaxID=2866162 RepID=A0ABZ1C982_9BACT|nr:family 78 glycoside hydrolase catalytic domain [Opitutus sp. WL0086]WRQ88259.1 family 78 glycoside hydrolase catalytic domain [Opitutus sp. WL0086]